LILPKVIVVILGHLRHLISQAPISLVQKVKGLRVLAAHRVIVKTGCRAS